jgi:hypothetical protein
VQDNIFGVDVTQWLDGVTARPRRLVVLRPTRDVVAQREAVRTATTGKIAYRSDGVTIDHLDAALAETERIGLWLDTSEQTPQQTVDEILEREAEAVVD